MALWPTERSGRATLAIGCLIAVVLLAGCSVQFSGSVGDGPTGPDADPDADGLETSLESELGTDPNDPDTDGDRLLDGWEYRNETDDGAALPGADPLRKDIYVQVVYAAALDPLTETERENLIDIWGAMNVTNPDGTQGVDLHVDDEPPHGGQVNVTGRRSDLPEDYHADLYARFVPASRQCVYHQTVFQDVDRDAVEAGGRGTLSGYATLVAGQRTDDFSRERQPGAYNVRERGFTHELLHNVVGEIGDSGRVHARTGWLAGGYDDVDGDAWPKRYETLSDVVATQLSKEGFSETRGTTASTCA